MTIRGRTRTRRKALSTALAAAVFLWGGAWLHAQGDIDDIDAVEEDIKSIEEISPEEESGPSWRKWEAGLQTGRIALTGNSYSQDAFAYGLQIMYRFGGKAKARDGTMQEVQGRHGVELGAIHYETDYFASHPLFTGSDAFPLFLVFGDTKLTIPNGWFAMEASGKYDYTVISAAYIYSQLDKKFRLRKITPYYVVGMGYATGSADISIDTRVRNIKCDDPPACTSWQYQYGRISESGGSGICDPNSPDYSLVLCSQAAIARDFYRYEFNPAAVAHLGAGIRWQWKPKWVFNFEIRDYLVLYDDSHFPAPGGDDLNEYRFLNLDAYGHSFFLKVVLVRNFNFGGGK